MDYDNCSSTLSCMDYQLSPAIAHSKSLKCHTCSYSTSKLSNLKRHIMTHTGEKPYKCRYCNKRFIQKVQLKSHVHVHGRVIN